MHSYFCTVLLLKNCSCCCSLTVSVVVPINGHVDLKTSLTPPLITHTAATPMPIPKISGGADPALTFESRRNSNIPVDPSFNNKSPVGVVLNYFYY